MDKKAKNGQSSFSSLWGGLYQKVLFGRLSWRFLLLSSRASFFLAYFQGWLSKLPTIVVSLSSPMDCSMPGSSVLGIFQARIREPVVISFSRASSQPRNPMCVSYISHIGRQFLYLPGKAPTVVGALSNFSINPICLSQLKSLSVLKTKSPNYLLRHTI